MKLLLILSKVFWKIELQLRLRLDSITGVSSPPEAAEEAEEEADAEREEAPVIEHKRKRDWGSVSYTHLKMPTIVRL